MCLIISYFLHYYYMTFFEVFFAYVILPLHLYLVSAFLSYNPPNASCYTMTL